MRRFVLLFVWPVLLSCGGSPTTPPTENPPPGPPLTNPTAATTPRPTATPPPCVQAGSCEAPTTNTNPPTRIEIRMYQVRKPNGDAAPCLNEDPVAPGGPAPNTRYWFAPVPVGYRVKLDATAFDQFNKPTNHDCSDDNKGCITWRFGEGEELIDEYGLGHIFQPTFRVAGAGDFQIQAEMYNNGSRVRSPWYWMSFVDNASESPCSR